MTFLTDLRQRVCEPELMDDPALESALHEAALRGLERINRVSRVAETLWRELRDLNRRPPQQALRVLDLATGAGDVPLRLTELAERDGAAVELAGCDRSPRALNFARWRAASRGRRVSFFELDLESDPLPAGYDVLICSLLLHHLDDSAAVELLRRMAAAARQRVLVSDLRRGRFGLLLCHVGTRLLTRSPVVHVDGPRSVRAAFTIDEVRELARRAGLEGARVREVWPARFMLSWSRP
jgi:SAM-dependent methyltransferase